MAVADGLGRLNVPNRDGARVMARRCAVFLILPGLLFAADAARPVLELEVSSETVPAGGTGQIKVFLTAPQPIGKGRVLMDLDPAVFGSIEHVAVFSAAGDATGQAGWSGRHLDVRFASSSGGIGRLPGLPVLVVSVNVLPGVAPGTTATITLDPTGAVWKDRLSAPYAVSVQPGRLTVGENPTIVSVEPGGGILPAGAAVRIRGTGFSPATSLDVGGVSVSSLRFVGPEELDFIFGAPAEMTGKRIRLSNPDGPQAEYVSSLRPVPNTGAIFPLETAQAATFFVGNPPHGFELVNPNPTPVDVIKADFNLTFLAGLTRFTLPSGGRYSTILSGNRFTNRSRVMASAPVWMLALGFTYRLEDYITADPYQVRAYYSVEPMPGPIPTHELSVTPRSLSLDWQIGSPMPAVQSVRVSTADEWVDFQATATTASGGQWLEVAGGPVFSWGNSAEGSSIPVDLFVIPSALTAGTYAGALTLTPIGFNIKPTVVNVSLTVRPRATGSASGQAPLLVESVFTELPQLVVLPRSLTFIAHAEGPTPAQQTVSVMPLDINPIIPTARTEAGGDWLFANLPPGPGVRVLYVGVKPAGLALGTYRGAVTVTSPNASSVEVPVTLIVWSGDPPPLKVTPDRVTLAIENGGRAAQTLELDTGGIPFPVFSQTFTFDGGDWLQGLSASSLRPGVHAGSSKMWLDYGFPTSVPPVVLPITLMVAAGPNAPPIMATVASAASQLQGSVSPGEIISIHGLGVGPPNPTGLVIDTADKVATNLSGLRVLFDGIPAPLLYASVPQTNVVVPYDVADRPVTTIEVEYKGTRSKAIGVPVAPAAPAIFTLNSTGLGGAAALNEDNTVNAPVNPASRGSVVQIYATGEGLTTPAGVTGAVTRGNLRKPLLPVSVTIDGKDAAVLYAGSAPESVAGLFQFNVVVPQEAAPGPSVPVLLSVGSWKSQAGVTVAVK